MNAHQFYAGAVAVKDRAPTAEAALALLESPAGRRIAELEADRIVFVEHLANLQRQNELLQARLDATVAQLARYQAAAPALSDKPLVVAAPLTLAEEYTAERRKLEPYLSTIRALKGPFVIADAAKAAKRSTRSVETWLQKFGAEFGLRVVNTPTPGRYGCPAVWVMEEAPAVVAK